MVTRLIVRAALADLVCVLVFAAVGRASHGEGLGPAGVLATTWPFALGWLVGWGLVLISPPARSRPLSVLPGVLVGLVTVVVGMQVRVISGAGTQRSFVVVASIVLGVLMLGWRGVAALVRRSRRETPADTQV